MYQAAKNKDYLLQELYAENQKFIFLMIHFLLWIIELIVLYVKH